MGVYDELKIPGHRGVQVKCWYNDLRTIGVLDKVPPVQGQHRYFIFVGNTAVKYGVDLVPAFIHIFDDVVVGVLYGSRSVLEEINSASTPMQVFDKQGDRYNPNKPKFKIGQRVLVVPDNYIGTIVRVGSISNPRVYEIRRPSGAQTFWGESRLKAVTYCAYCGTEFEEKKDAK